MMRYAILHNAYISIHPPRAGRDGRPDEGSGLATYFNPPSPCGEGLL